MYDVIELTVSIATACDKGLELLLKFTYLAMDRINLPLSISPMPNLQVVYFLCEHEHSVFS